MNKGGYISVFFFVRKRSVIWWSQITASLLRMRSGLISDEIRQLEER
jgi:hypothetical protein